MAPASSSSLVTDVKNYLAPKAHLCALGITTGTLCSVLIATIAKVSYVTGACMGLSTYALFAICCNRAPKNWKRSVYIFSFSLATLSMTAVLLTNKVLSIAIPVIAGSAIITGSIVLGCLVGLYVKKKLT